jgi:hypothetical protein
MTRAKPIEHAVAWWIGYWWAFGEHRYGDRKAIVEAEDWAGPSFQTCVDCGTVARRFESTRRHVLLSFKHHREVAALADLIGLLRRALDEARYPLSRRYDPIKAILAKLEPARPPYELPPPLPAAGPRVGRGR